MLTLFLMMVPVVVWPFVAKLLWKHEITLLEMVCCLFLGVAVACGGYAAGKYGQVLDVEVLNGLVTSKARERVGCEHSYQCNCVQSCTKDSCTTICQTCYDHAYDYDWVLHTQIGEIIVPRRSFDPQGLSEPARFTLVKPGDAVAKTESFKNYIKAAPNSLFNAASAHTLKARFPDAHLPYPAEVYDLYRLNRVVAAGVVLPDSAAWNQGLSDVLGALGPSKQVNAVMVFTRHAEPDFSEALRAYWLGGKKNDVVVVFGVPEYPAVSWVRVFSWSDAELFKVELRDALQSIGTVDRPRILSVFREHVAKGFIRKPMADFKHLESEIEVPTWVAILGALGALLVSVVTSMYCVNNSIRNNVAIQFPRFRRY